MVRGGYIKNVANGIYSQFPPMKRISQKIEAIIRDEMDKIDGQEVLFPVALPGSLWEESGRYESVGSELLRFTDRTGSKMVPVSYTHLDVYKRQHLESDMRFQKNVKYQFLT